MARLLDEALRIMKSAFCRWLDRVKLWWGYQLSVADRDLYQRKLQSKGISTEEERDDASLTLSIHESFVTLYERDRLLDQCVRYGVAIPRDGDPNYYDEMSEPNLLGLTTEGKRKLFAEIQAAKRERIDRLKSVALAVSAVLGTLVALISLV